MAVLCRHVVVPIAGTPLAPVPILAHSETAGPAQDAKERVQDLTPICNSLRAHNVSAELGGDFPVYRIS